MTNEQEFAGKVAFVSGGSRGIGAATCRLLAARGAKVAVNGRDRAAIEAVVRSIVDAGGQALGAPADCTSEAELLAARDAIESVFGVVDIVMAFAGGGGEPTPFVQTSLAKWRQVVEANLTATFLTLQTFIPRMTRGSIVTMASAAGRAVSPAAAPYAASKAGIVMLTGHLASELARQNVRINCISPSAIVTAERLGRLPETKLAEIAAGFPLGRLGTPDDCAEAAAFLASDRASWITGVTLDISGGRVIVS